MSQPSYLLKGRSYELEIEKPIVIEGDVTITADWHIPLHDVDFANEMILRSRKSGIEQLLIAGDFFNFDTLSKYLPKQDGADFHLEYRESLAIMETLLKTFENVVYLWGNHDARLVKELGYKIAFDESIKLVFGALGKKALAKIRFSNLDHALVNSSDEIYYVCHPESYTRTPLYTAKALAGKLNINVITAHSHHCAVGFAPDGETIVAEAGGLFAADKTAYLQRSTTHPIWQQGYAILQDGKLKVFNPRWECG